jgi:hypothetical protein
VGEGVIVGVEVGVGVLRCKACGRLTDKPLLQATRMKNDASIVGAIKAKRRSCFIKRIMAVFRMVVNLNLGFI